MFIWAAAMLASLVVLAQVSSSSPWVRGFMAGTYATAVVATCVYVLLMRTSGGLGRLQGAYAEEFTAEVFTTRRRKAEGWRVFHGLKFLKHDVDHVAIGPAGVFAIETKWVGSSDWRVIDGKLTGYVGRDPIAQARESANRISRFLRSTTAGDPVPTQVQGLLVLWGPGAPIDQGCSTYVDGVHVLSGREADTWAGFLDRPVLEPHVVEAIVVKIGRFAQTQVAGVEAATNRRWSPVGRHRER